MIKKRHEVHLKEVRRAEKEKEDNVLKRRENLAEHKRINSVGDRQE